MNIKICFKIINDELMNNFMGDFMNSISRFCLAVTFIGLLGASQVHAMISGNAVALAQNEEQAELFSTLYPDRIVLINRTGINFSCFLMDAGGLQTVIQNDFYVAFFPFVATFYINTTIPSRTASRADNHGTPIMDRVSFGLETNLFRRTTYVVEMLEGRAEWTLRFTEAYPSNPAAPHVITKIRRK